MDRVMRDCLTAARAAYRRVAHSRMWSTVLRLAQTVQFRAMGFLSPTVAENHFVLIIAARNLFNVQGFLFFLGGFPQCPKSCISFVLSPRACSSLRSAANCSSSIFIRADASQYPACLPESNGVTIDGRRRTIVAVAEERGEEIGWGIAGNTDLKDSDCPSPHHRIDDRPGKLGQSWKAGTRYNHKRNRDVASPVRSPYEDQ
jgi:hypothetical protein